MTQTERNTYYRNNWEKKFLEVFTAIVFSGIIFYYAIHTLSLIK